MPIPVSRTARRSGRPAPSVSRLTTTSPSSVNFKAFLPHAQIVQTALIPPLNVSQQKNHGLAIEYVAGDDALLLSEWPRGGIALSGAPLDLTADPCAPVAYKTNGLIWTTRNGLVMTLQPDRTAPASHIAHEAQRLGCVLARSALCGFDCLDQLGQRTVVG